VRRLHPDAVARVRAWRTDESCVGTDLFEVLISASYGTISHAIKGNVDIMIALVMQNGAAVGAQIGVVLTQFFRGPRIRLAFSPLPLVGAALIVYELLTGHQTK
jgi:uncharacterized protein